MNKRLYCLFIALHYKELHKNHTDSIVSNDWNLTFSLDRRNHVRMFSPTIDLEYTNIEVLKHHLFTRLKFDLYIQCHSS